MLGELDRRHADTAAGAEHQHAFAGLQLAPFNQRMPGGRRGGLPTRALGERQRIGQGRQCALVDNPLLGQRAAFAPGHDPISGPDPLNIGRDFDHFPRSFEPGHKGRVGTKLIFAPGHQQIRKIQSRCVHPDPDFAGPEGPGLLLENLDRRRPVKCGAGGCAVAVAHGFTAATTSRVNASISKRLSPVS